MHENMLTCKNICLLDIYAFLLISGGLQKRVALFSLIIISLFLAALFQNDINALSDGF